MPVHLCPIDGERFRLHVENVPVLALGPGDIVVMDRPGSHRGEAVRQLGTILSPSVRIIPIALERTTADPAVENRVERYEEAAGDFGCSTVA